ncbi:hypothetical protein HMI54_015836 [Coelomomyces lativittatus]|nr:hypothetical protein HMI55_002913 [Coelomomyces lativittatus]KAJ1512240.1 hypothetical protein HMI54_015836 [Coelomomyces lativittatus]
MASLSSSTITSNSPSVYPHLNSNTSSQSVILVTAGYDHSIRFWDPLYGSTTHSIPYPDSVRNPFS